MGFKLKSDHSGARHSTNCFMPPHYFVVWYFVVYCLDVYVLLLGGEGCNIASGGAVIGIGSDIGGSIRMPSFFNGIFGHKPSRGNLSEEIGTITMAITQQNWNLGLNSFKLQTKEVSVWKHCIGYRKSICLKLDWKSKFSLKLQKIVCYGQLNFIQLRNSSWPIRTVNKLAFRSLPQ